MALMTDDPAVLRVLHHPSEGHLSRGLERIRKQNVHDCGHSRASFTALFLLGFTRRLAVRLITVSLVPS